MPSPVLAAGKQGVGTTSGVFTVSVSNCASTDIAACSGSGTLILGNPYFTITGTNAGDWSNTGAGTCSANQVLVSGESCTVTLTFTPSAASGAAETATLTINDNGRTSTQTMSLTGTSATVTKLATSACPTALSNNTNYQLTANITCAGTAFTVSSTTAVDLNLNGFNIIFGSGSNSSPVFGVEMTGSQNLVVHNGAIEEGTGLNTGLIGNAAGASDVGSSSAGNSDRGTQMYNLTLSCSTKWCKMLYQEGNKLSGNAVQFHDNIFADTDTAQCNAVICRENSQSYAVTLYDNEGEAGTQFYNNFGTGGPQGALNTAANGSVFQYNVVDPGTTAATNTNGFGYQLWAGNGTISDNVVAGVAGTCISCRGIQVSNVVQAVQNDVIQNNTIRTMGLNNDAEYSNCASAQEAYSYGMQINTAGSTNTFTGNNFQNNKVVVVSGVCGGFGFSWSGTNQTGNTTKSNHLECDLAPGVIPQSLQACAGFRMDAKQYSYVDYGVTSQGDTILGDTAAIHIWYDGTPSWRCSQCSFGKGTNPVANWVFIDFYYGAGSGGGANPLYFVDPTFLAGSESQTNLSQWASNNASNSSSYFIQFTQTVTVKGASGSPISGASVTYTDALSNQYTGTTNSNGVATVIVNENQYAATSGTYKVTHYNNYSYNVTATGCGTGTASGLNITSPNSITVSLPGC